MQNTKQVERLPKEDDSSAKEASPSSTTKTLLGSRQTMAGVEYALMGMKVGGYRKVRVSPHRHIATRTFQILFLPTRC